MIMLPDNPTPLDKLKAMYEIASRIPGLIDLIIDIEKRNCDTVDTYEVDKLKRQLKEVENVLSEYLSKLSHHKV